MKGFIEIINKDGKTVLLNVNTIAIVDKGNINPNITRIHLMNSKEGCAIHYTFASYDDVKRMIEEAM